MRVHNYVRIMLRMFDNDDCPTFNWCLSLFSSYSLYISVCLSISSCFCFYLCFSFYLYSYSLIDSLSRDRFRSRNLQLRPNVLKMFKVGMLSQHHAKPSL